MKSILRIVFVLFTASIFFSENVSASDKDNGGSLTLLQKQSALSKEELTAYLTTKSAVLRRIVEGLVLYGDFRSIQDDVLKRMVVTMLNWRIFVFANDRRTIESYKSTYADQLKGTHDILVDIRYSNYSIDADAFRTACGNDEQKDLCTENMKQGSTIFFNIERLVSQRISLAQLVGLIMHEHSRHFVGDADADHKLADFYMSAFMKNEHLGKRFTKTDDLITLVQGERYLYGYRAISLPRSDEQTLADLFCENRGYKKSLNFTISDKVAAISGIWSFSSRVGNDNRLTVDYTTVRSYEYQNFFTEIVCIGSKNDD